MNGCSPYTIQIILNRNPATIILENEIPSNEAALQQSFWVRVSLWASSTLLITPSKYPFTPIHFKKKLASPPLPQLDISVAEDQP